jgi:hypothetical protein
MVSLSLRSVAILFALSAPALAASHNWNVTEESPSGVKSSQGVWTVRIDDNKISGSANMQRDNGAILTYSLDGSFHDSAYTVNMVNRSDGKKDCVWSGHSPTHDDQKSRGLIGEVLCDGRTAFTIRAGF